jgi:pimeloyl-ACP methyl ester carboxylesterase
MLPFEEAGSGPPVVLLHAGIADRTMWSEHLDPLAAAGYRVIAFDMPGFGEAPVKPGAQAPWNDVLTAMDGLGIDRAALVGNSFGGAVALRAAFVAPERSWALAMISAPAPDLEPSPELTAAFEAEESALERGDTDEAVEAVIDTWTLPDAPKPLRDRIATMQRRAYELQKDAKDATEAPDPIESLEALSRLDVPTLVAVGEHDMPDFRKSAEEMARVIPGARHEIIEGAGHLAPLETPDAFRSLLVQFLDERGTKGEG